MVLHAVIRVLLAASPVSRHVGVWNRPPERCPSSMVTDGYVARYGRATIQQNNAAALESRVNLTTSGPSARARTDGHTARASPDQS